MKISFTIFATLFLSTNLYALRNGGVGHDTTMEAASANIREGVSFYNDNHTHQRVLIEIEQHDFNNDGNYDRVICENRVIAANNKPRINVRVIDGKDDSTIFTWFGPGYLQDRPYDDNRKMDISGCQVIYLAPGKPSIVVATKFNALGIGDRIRSPQFLIYRSTTSNTMTPTNIMIPDSTLPFTAAARSVKCTQVTKTLLRTTRKSGALCFFAGYDTNLHNGNYGTNTSLVKFEQGTGDDFITKDITQNTGLPWAGMHGTKYTNISNVKRCNGTESRDGLHMMDSAFLDYNSDDLPDFISVGQHASIRSHQMVLDSSKPEGFKFTTSYIHQANSGMSEFLRVTAIKESDKFVDSNCLYFSGENDQSCGKVRDHLRCFKNNAWETIFPPRAERFSSMTRPITKPNGQGRLIIKANNEFFSLKQAYEREVELTVGALQTTATHLIVNGWACMANTPYRPRILITSAPTPIAANDIIYYDGVTNIQSELILMQRCENPNASRYRFKASIAKSSLATPSGTLYIRADTHAQGANLPVARHELAY